MAAGGRQRFDPAADRRSFTVATSHYAALVFLRPLLARLAQDPPGVRCLVPIALGMGDALRRRRLDLVLLPLDLPSELHGLPPKALLEDRFLVAADLHDSLLSGITGLDEETAELLDVPGGIDLKLMKQLAFVAVAGEMPSLIDLRLQEHGIELRVDVSTENLRHRADAATGHSPGEPGAGATRAAGCRPGAPQPVSVSDRHRSDRRGHVLDPPPR